MKKIAFTLLPLILTAAITNAQSVDFIVPKGKGLEYDVHQRIIIPQDQHWHWSGPIKLRRFNYMEGSFGGPNSANFPDIQVQFLGQSGYNNIGYCDATTFETLDSGREIPRWICRSAVLWQGDPYTLGFRLTPCKKEFALYPRTRDTSFFEVLQRILVEFATGEITSLPNGEFSYTGMPVEGTPFESCMSQ